MASALYDELAGALVGLARCTDTACPDDTTWKVILEALAVMDQGDQLPDSRILGQLKAVHKEKARLVPDCMVCQNPCGRHDDFDMSTLADEGFETKLKRSILASLTSYAATAPTSDPTVENTLGKALFCLGETWSVSELEAVRADVDALLSR